MRKFKFSIAIAALCFVSVLPVFSNTVGFTYQSAVDDAGWGLHGDWEHEVNRLKIGVEGQLQSNKSYAGNLDLALTIFDKVRFESNNIFAGPSISGLGRDNDLGMSYVFKIGGLEISAGLFGKNGNPFQPVYRLKDPTDPMSAELKDSGILIKDGSSLNGALRTEFDVSVLDKDIEVGLRSLIEVLGDPGTEKAHQLRADIQTGGTLVGNIDWIAQAQVVAQIWGENITWQRVINGGVNYQF